MASLLRKQIARGIGWNFINQILAQIMQVGVMVVLARLLSPHDYGVVGLVITFTGFAGIFVDLGLTPAVIQKLEPSQRELSTAFWTNNFMGWLIFTLLWFLAHPVALFYKEPEVLWITRWAALPFVISPLFALHNALLVKEMNFKMITKLGAVSLTISSAVSVLMAMWGWGYWSLVIPQVISSVVWLVILWVMVPWRPSFEFSGLALKQFFAFSGSSASQIIGYWTRNLDKVMLGRMAGAVELGFIPGAYNLMLLPLQQVSRVVDTVLFPAFASIQSNKHEIAQIYLKMTRLVALITFPLCFGLWAVAEPLILVVFGEKWRGTISILHILCPLGALQSILYLNGSLYLSQGQSRRALLVVSVFTPLLAAAFYFGLLTRGLNGMLWTYLAFSLVSAPLVYLAAARLVGLTLLDMVKNLRGVTGCALVMTLGVFVFRSFLLESANIVQLLILIPMGALIYCSTLKVFNVRAFEEAWSLLRNKVTRNRAPNSPLPTKETATSP